MKNIILITVACSLSFLEFDAASDVPVAVEQIYPDENVPICLGSIVTYRCTTSSSGGGQLIWEYSGDVHVFFADITDSIGQLITVGNFEVVLESIDQDGSNYTLISNATSANGLTVADSKQVLSCRIGSVSEDIVIKFADPIISDASVGTSTIFWTPPPCIANCTVRVDGGNIATLPCSKGFLSSTIPDLSEKSLLIIAVDELSNSRNTSSAGCVVSFPSAIETFGLVKNSTSTFASMCGPVSIEHVYNIEDQAGSVYKIIDEASSAEVHYYITGTQLVFSGHCSTTYKIFINTTLAAIVEPQNCDNSVNHAACGLLIFILLVVCLFVTTVVVFGMIWIKRKESFILRNKKDEDSNTIGGAELSNFRNPKEKISHSEAGTEQKAFQISDESVYINYQHPITHCLLSPDAKFVASSDTSGTLRVCEILDSGEFRTVATTNCKPVILSLDWFQHGDGEGRSTRLLLGTGNGLMLFNPATTKTYSYLYVDRDPSVRVLSVISHLKSNLLAFSSVLNATLNATSSVVEIRNISNKKHKALEFEVAICCLAFNHDGTQLVAGGADGRIFMHNVVNGVMEPTFFLKAHETRICSILINSESQSVYSRAQDGKLCGWNISQSTLGRMGSWNLADIESDEGKYVARITMGKLLAFTSYSENQYIVTFSPREGNLFEVNSEGKLIKTSMCLPNNNTPVTCIDWGNVNDTSSRCVMGSTDNSVRCITLKFKTF